MKTLSKILVLIAIALSVGQSARAGEADQAGTDLQSGMRWRKTRIPVAVSTSLLRNASAIRPDSDINGALRRSFAVWEAVADIEFEISWTDKTAVSPAGRSGDGVSLITIAPSVENLLMFGGENSGASARSRVFYNRRKEISEADIVFNPYQQFSTDGSFGTYDFESILTHEIGHLLGLDHSELPGSTMYERQGKNGTFGVVAFGPRTLAEDDLTQLRAIYGNAGDPRCCGFVNGKLSVVGPKDPGDVLVWLERTDTGRVATATRLSSDGSFKFGGLVSGKYKLYGQEKRGGFSGAELGEISVAADRETSFSKRTEFSPRRFSVRQTGFNGQLTDLAIPVNRGRSYLVLASGSGIGGDDSGVFSTASGMSLDILAKPPFDFGDALSIIAFEASPSDALPIGEYTVVVTNADGELQYLPAILCVESFNNPWTATPFD